VADDTGFQRPTLAELISRIQADFNSRIQGADSRVRRSVLNVFARVLAGAFHTVYGFLDFIARQLFPDTAIESYLQRFGAIWDVQQKPAEKAQGSYTVTGANGTVIGVGEIVQRGDGVQFETTTSATISGGSAILTVLALEAGAAGNTQSGTKLTFKSPIAGVFSEGTAGDIVGGADIEDVEVWRQRILDRLRQPPHGGADFDYVTWAKEVAAVTRAWTFGKENGSGSVTVRFMMDEAYADGIPESGDVANVKAYIEARRPVTAEVFVAAPESETLDFTIRLKNSAGEITTDPTIRAAVEAELLDMLQREAEPKADGTINTTPTGKILFSHIRQAISNAAGEYDHNITAPTTDVTPSGTGKIFVMGDITWLES
jgi:uncharacterized phage protein gp47/JayE